MALNTEITDILDINQRKTTVLDGQAQITFDQDRNNRGVTQGSFKGLSLGFSPSQFTVDAPIYENVKDAYNNDEGNHQSQWKIPKDDELVSLGIVTYTNELVDGEDGNDVGNSRSKIGNGKLGITINEPIDVTQKIKFPIRIYDQLEGPETIALKSTNRPFKFLMRGTPIYFDYVGGKAISNATAVDTPTQYKEADPGLEDLSFNFEVQDGTTAQIELFGRFYTTKDLPDPVIITSISEDTGVAGDFRTSDDTLLINGTAEPLSEVSVFLDGNEIGTTTTNIVGSWSFDHSDTKLVDGEYELTATATDSTGNSVSTNQVQPLTIDTTYDIEFDFSDKSISGNKALQKRIKKAASLWETVIKNDISDVLANNSDIDNIPLGNRFIDDLLIKVKIIPASPESNNLANTSDFKVRPVGGVKMSSIDDSIPYYATISIPENKVKETTESFYGLTTLWHEIGHAVGLNSRTFNERNLIKEIGKTDDFIRFGFTGKNALDAYHSIGGSSSHRTVPMEDIERDSLTGLRKNDKLPSHWHEWLFPDSSEENFENIPIYYPGFFRKIDGLMTSSNPPGKDAFLTKISIGALEDLGFSVNPSPATDLKVYEGTWNDPFWNIDLLGGHLENPLFSINY